MNGKGRCLSDQTEQEKQRKQERERWPPHHPSSSLLLSRHKVNKPFSLLVSSLIIWISWEQVENLPMGCDYFIIIIQVMENKTGKKCEYIKSGFFSIKTSRLETILFALEM